MFLGRIKPLDAILATAEKKSLKRTLGAFQLPLFAVIFAAVMLGVVLGGTASWLAQGKTRKSRRRLRRETRQLRYETERLKAQTPSNSNLPATVPAQARSI